jgi:hypothetical protein
MTFTRLAIACTAPIALSLAALSAPALAAQASPAFERAMLAEMAPATRADVQKRAAGGPTVSGVIATILLNNYHARGAKQPGAPLTVIAIDYGRGVAVLGKDQATFEIIHFDPKTLALTAS